MPMEKIGLHQIRGWSVDAALKAIQKIAVDMANIRIREYRLGSITGGSDAMAEVT